MNMIESMAGAADTQDEVVETHSEKSGAFIGGLAGVVAGGVAGLVLGGITGAVTGGGGALPGVNPSPKVRHEECPPCRK